jgi:hypothetical protein
MKKENENENGQGRLPCFYAGYPISVPQDRLSGRAHQQPRLVTGPKTPKLQTQLSYPGVFTESSIYACTLFCLPREAPLLKKAREPERSDNKMQNSPHPSRFTHWGFSKVLDLTKQAPRLLSPYSKALHHLRPLFVSRLKHTDTLIRYN